MSRTLSGSRINAPIVALAILSGCGGYQINGAAPSPASNESTEHTAHAARSGLSATNQDLLYASDSSGDVYVYTYPQGKLLETLTGFARPSGECVDSTGDVFITAYAPSYSSSIVYEYAHGGQTPLATLSDAGIAFSCAIDPITGDLAVVNTYDTNNPYNPQLGSIAIYSNAKGKPTSYYSPKFGPGGFCGYDDKGDLYSTAGTTSSSEIVLVRLAKGGSNLEEVSLGRKLYSHFQFAPSIQWDGQRLTISSLGKNQERGRGSVSVYRLRISASTARVVGTTTLVADKPNRHTGQSWILGETVIGSDLVRGTGWVSYWRYPKGGAPVHNIRHAAPKLRGTLVGLTISLSPSR